MKRSLGYYLLRAFTWPMQLFPLEFHYLLSSFLYVLIYYIAGYRKTVVKTNLKNSFPEKTDLERKKIERDFYKGFTDMFIETLYFVNINPAKEANRLKLDNMELIEKLVKQGKSVIGVCGHFGNWEFLNLKIHQLNVATYFVYKQLNNKSFDQFYRDMRSRIAIPLEMKQTFRQLMTDTRENKPYAALFISDQRPMRSEIKHWVTFMNQDTPVMLGTEKIAHKTNAAVVYIEIKKIKRGYHQASFKLLVEDPLSCEKYEVTNKFMAALEQSIRKYPDQYLWTHKRWKFKKEDQIN